MCAPECICAYALLECVCVCAYYLSVGVCLHYLSVCVCALLECVGVCLHYLHTAASSVWRVSVSLELEWMLGAEPVSSGRTEVLLNTVFLQL